MGSLIYMTSMSLDGFIEDESGSFAWGEPDEEVHQFANDLARPFGTHLYGRRLYETMAVWETDPSFADAEPGVMRDFADVWATADKIVFSKTLAEPFTTKTSIERSFDPAMVQRLKDASDAPLLVGGAELAAHAFAADLVDDVHLLVHPVVVGGGKRALPQRRLALDLTEQRRFASGVVHLHYEVQRPAS